MSPGIHNPVVSPLYSDFHPAVATIIQSFTLLYPVVFRVSSCCIHFRVSPCCILWYSEFHPAVVTDIHQSFALLYPLVFRVSPCCIHWYSEFHPAVSTGIQSFTLLYPLVFRVSLCCIHWYSEFHTLDLNRHTNSILVDIQFIRPCRPDRLFCRKHFRFLYRFCIYFYFIILA
jgi:hypothetical protein